jgi:hypothetical protein
VRASPGGPAQDRDGLVGGAVPVAVERLGSLVEEHESGVVDRSGGVGVELGVQGASELVGGQEVEAAVADEGGGAADGVEGPLDIGPDEPFDLAAARPHWRRVGGSDKVHEVGVLGVVELQGPCQCLEDAVRDPLDVAALEAGVIRNADPGEDGDLFAAQSGDAARAVARQSNLVRADPGPTGGQELADLGLSVHDFQGRPTRLGVGDPASTPIKRGCLSRSISAFVEISEVIRRKARSKMASHQVQVRGEKIMSSWSEVELRAIGANDDLFVSPFRGDGTTYGTPTQTWAVIVDGDVYVRAANGQESRWYRAAINQKAGRVRVAGTFFEVTFEPAGNDVADAIDAGYEAKYPGSSAVPIIQGTGPKSATVRIVPRRSHRERAAPRSWGLLSAHLSQGVSPKTGRT